MRRQGWQLPGNAGAPVRGTLQELRNNLEAEASRGALDEGVLVGLLCVCAHASSSRCAAVVADGLCAAPARAHTTQHLPGLHGAGTVSLARAVLTGRRCHSGRRLWRRRRRLGRGGLDEGAGVERHRGGQRLCTTVTAWWALNGAACLLRPLHGMRFAVAGLQSATDTMNAACGWRWPRERTVEGSQSSAQRFRKASSLPCPAASLNRCCSANTLQVARGLLLFSGGETAHRQTARPRARGSISALAQSTALIFLQLHGY